MYSRNFLKTIISCQSKYTLWPSKTLQVIAIVGWLVLGSVVNSAGNRAIPWKSIKRPLSILKLDIYVYFQEELKHYDSPLKRKMFEETTSHVQYLDSLKGKKKWAVADRRDPLPFILEPFLYMFGRFLN